MRGRFFIVKFVFVNGVIFVTCQDFTVVIVEQKKPLHFHVVT